MQVKCFTTDITTGTLQRVFVFILELQEHLLKDLIHNGDLNNLHPFTPTARIKDSHLCFCFSFVLVKVSYLIFIVNVMER